jgi:hypothetical protein
MTTDGGYDNGKMNKISSPYKIEYYKKKIEKFESDTRK